jgi:hypothetical protein
VDGDILQVVELKSCENMPDTAYASHEIQLFGQMGLLASCLGQSVFSLNQGKPGRLGTLLKREMGIPLPKQPIITGSILCVSMTEAKVFGPYLPNDLMFGVCQNLASDLWNYLQAVASGEATLDDVPCSNGFNPLCNWCEWNRACPRFTSIAAPELEEDLLEMQRLKAEKEGLELQLQALDKQLRMTCQQVGEDWLAAETLRVRLISCEGRRSFDKELLQGELVRHLDMETTANVMAASYKNGKPYDRLVVNVIN